MRWSIRYQLLVPLLTLLLGVVGISTWTGVASADRARHQLETQVRNIAATLESASFPLNEHVLEMTRGLSGAEYLVVRPDGRRTATLGQVPADLPSVESMSDGPQNLGLGPRLAVGGETYLCSGLALRQGPEAGATLYILYPERLWRDALWEAVFPSLVLGAFGGLASIALAIGVAQRLSRRLRELVRRTRLIAAGDFSPMPLPGRNDELRDLGKSVNEMAQQLDRLQGAMQQNERLRLLGQLSGGLAHQLRNGVTGARLAVQLHASECNGQGDAEALEVALRQLALVEANLKRFLDLGRTGGTRKEPCSLKALVEEAVALLRPRCRHAHIDLRWQAPAGDFPAQGDPGRLGHLFLNVLGNAIEAAGPGGSVEVNFKAADEKPPPSAALAAVDHAEASTGPAAVVRRCVIEVLDSGPGPPPELAGRLFEPFVTGKREGVGLGLVVARQVAEAHGGTIGWERRDERTVFHIELPLASSAVETWN